MLEYLFPKSTEHDVTVTMFVGHKDGYELNDFFGLQLHQPPRL
jgi:hypothetical protein